MDQPKKTRRRVPHFYTEDAIQKCLESIRNQEHTLYSACKLYGIPESTIRFRLSSKWSNKTTKGPPTTLLPEEETRIVTWLKNMERKGFPVVKKTLIFKVKAFLDASGRPNPFNNNTPGRKWFSRFLARHDDITLRTPEQVTAASSKVSESDIRGWFSSVKEYLVSEGISDALEDSGRIFNGDETSFFLHPTTKAVLATPGNKNVYEVQHADGHTNVTVMFSFGADGSIVPPDVILPVQRIRTEILQQFPGGWGVGKSPNGWMNTENFMLYISKIFYPFLLKKKVKFPVLYFVDGHSSHMAVEVADLCSDLGIVLIALYPNTTRITQPADVAIFKPLKNAWNTAVCDWRVENGGDVLSLKYFPTVLEKAIDAGIKQSSIVNGFRACGLFPFDPQNIDFSKCLAQSKPQSENEQPSDVDDTMDQNVTDSFDQPANEVNANNSQECVVIPIETVKDALDCIGAERLNKIWTQQRLTEEEKIIQSLYEKLLAPHLTLLPANESAPDYLQLRCDANAEIPSDEIALVDDQSKDVAGEDLCLKDCTNTQQNCKRKCDSIEDFLQTPPTPKRSKQHRNYARRFFPILTAEERLNEICRLEQEKENAVKEKQLKAEQREKDKENAEAVKAKKREEKEAMKQQKSELRDQHRQEVLQRKKEREMNRKFKQLKADGMKKEKLELLQALKLSKRQN